MSYYLGIDPGASGGMALVSDDSGDAIGIRYPGDVKTAADTLREWSEKYEIKLAGIEQVHSMPGQGVASVFKFGTNFGAWLGILSALNIPHILVTPRKWQKEMLDAGTGETKERSLQMARRLFPNVDMKYKADDGIADALHLARYAQKYV